MQTECFEKFTTNAACTDEKRAYIAEVHDELGRRDARENPAKGEQRSQIGLLDLSSRLTVAKAIQSKFQIS